jgi:hypothetical protein
MLLCLVVVGAGVVLVATGAGGFAVVPVIGRALLVVAVAGWWLTIGRTRGNAQPSRLS